MHLLREHKAIFFGLIGFFYLGQVNIVSSRISEPVPMKLHHLAIIPDGNRRWAKGNGLSIEEGHREAFLCTFPRIIEQLFDHGLHTLTLWMFSTENWNRSTSEVTALMNLYEKGLCKLLSLAHKQQYRMIHMGRKDRIPLSLRECIIRVEQATAAYKNHVFNFAIDYGGRDELVRTFKKIKYPQMPTEEFITSNLDTANQPYPFPDLIIRTSGEQRASGFMIWQASYSEWYYEPHFFPESSWEDIQKALSDFEFRRRRFGH